MKPSTTRQENFRINSTFRLDFLVHPITRAITKKLKKTLNGLVQNILTKMDLEILGMPKEHEKQPLIHLIEVQEEPNSCGSKGCQI
jgi:hypothetical protein